MFRQDPQPELEAVLRRYGDEYLEYETERHLEYRAISLLSLEEAGLRPEDAGRADGAPRSILEVGCATGALLSSFHEAGWRAQGVEVGPSMAGYARERFGLDVETATIESATYEIGSFDAVVATHLIEHLNDPRSFLARARAALRPEGRLYLITPNADGLQARLMGSRWRSAIRDHLFLFSARTLGAMLADEGYSVEYVGTWGGWPAGMRPVSLKRPMDRLAKRYGLGDVMVVRASQATVPTPLEVR
ncbi:MAG TPA: class I SAM-dependent methyltransferase [Spirochaetales bacterium]|nr:class I SAM-dependent methyltransferase [Spirochaetales bacterium]